MKDIYRTLLMLALKSVCSCERSYLKLHFGVFMCMFELIMECLMHVYTLTGHFIRYTLLVPGWTPFCLQNCLNSLWHRFNKVLETFLWDFGPYWHDSIMQLLQICRLHIHDVNLPFHHIPKVLYWIEIWWLEAIWGKWTHCHVQETSLRWFELCDMVHYSAGSSHQKMGTL